MQFFKICAINFWTKWRAFLSALFILAPVSAFSHTGLNPEDLSGPDARRILCSVLNVLHANNGAGVWPGYDPLQAPLIVKFRDGVFGYGDPSSFGTWEKKKSRACVYFSAPPTFSPPSSPIVPYFQFNGTNAFFFDATIKPLISSWLISAVVHERFHRFQWEHFPSLFPLLNATYTEHASVDNVAESFLENRRLTSYLKSGQDRDWIDFLSVASLREPALSGESKKWELGQQIAEGTAVFVQLKAFEAVEKKFKLGFRKTWRQRMLNSLSESEGVDGIIKWRHYAVGSMICDDLNRRQAGESWKVKLQTENSVSLFRYALQFSGVDDSMLKVRGQQIVDSLEGDSLRSTATLLITEYLDEIKKSKDLISSSRLQVKIDRPTNHCSGGGASEKTYYLPEGGTLGLSYSGSYQCDTSYREAFTENPAVQEAKGSVYFGLDTVNIWLDSSSFRFRDGDFKFNSIKMEGDSFSMQVSLPGKISISGTGIRIAFGD